MLQELNIDVMNQNYLIEQSPCYVCLVFLCLLYMNIFILNGVLVTVCQCEWTATTVCT